MSTYTRPHSVFRKLDILNFLKKEALWLLSVSKWRRILRGKTKTKSAPKRIFSGNDNGLKECYFLNYMYMRTKECPHIVCKTRLCVCICIRIQTRDNSPRLGWSPRFYFVYKTNEDIAEKTVQTMGEQWEVPDWRCLHMCVCVCLGIQTGDL